MLNSEYKPGSIYYGYYGNLRAEWIQKHQPDVFHALKSSGQLDSYLDGFQNAYVARARKLRPKIQKKLLFHENLYYVDYPTFLMKAAAVEKKIHKILRAEIEH